MYRLCKVHEKEVDGCPSFRSILLTLQTPTYNLVKFLVLISNTLTKSVYTVKDSFTVKDWQDPTLSIGSLNVD